MRLLLDTQVVIWWFGVDSRLSPEAAAKIREADLVFVSAVSVWEIGIKAALGKLKTPDDIEVRMQATNFAQLPVSFAHARAAAKLPLHHRDPFDRMLIGQASIENLMLVTADALMQRYEIGILAAD